jgi:hypothetical protein
MLEATIFTSTGVGVTIAFGSTRYFTAIQNVGRVKSSVDDLIMERGTVSMRVAFVLRSAEVQPLFRDLCGADVTVSSLSCHVKSHVLLCCASAFARCQFLPTPTFHQTLPHTSGSPPSTTHHSSRLKGKERKMETIPSDAGRVGQPCALTDHPCHTTLCKHTSGTQVPLENSALCVLSAPPSSPREPPAGYKTRQSTKTKLNKQVMTHLITRNRISPMSTVPHGPQPPSLANWQTS